MRTYLFQRSSVAQHIHSCSFEWVPHKKKPTIIYNDSASEGGGAGERLICPVFIIRITGREQGERRGRMLVLLVVELLEVSFQLSLGFD